MWGPSLVLGLGAGSFKDGGRSWAVGAIFGFEQWPTEQSVKLVGVVAHQARADVVNGHPARLGVGVQGGSTDSVSVDDLLRGECSHGESSFWLLYSVRGIQF
jgi:hypothetical protein